MSVTDPGGTPPVELTVTVKVTDSDVAGLPEGVLLTTATVVVAAETVRLLVSVADAKPDIVAVMSTAVAEAMLPCTQNDPVVPGESIVIWVTVVVQVESLMLTFAAKPAVRFISRLTLWALPRVTVNSVVLPTVTLVVSGIRVSVGDPMVKVAVEVWLQNMKQLVGGFLTRTETDEPL